MDVTKIMQGAVLGEAIISSTLEICYVFESDEYTGTCCRGLPHGKIFKKSDDSSECFKYGMKEVFYLRPYDIDSILLLTNVRNIDKHRAEMFKYFELKAEIDGNNFNKDGDV